MGDLRRKLNGGKPKRVTGSPARDTYPVGRGMGNGFISPPIAEVRSRSGKCRRTEAKRYG